jgi:hypothetical protein
VDCTTRANHRGQVSVVCKVVIIGLTLGTTHLLGDVIDLNLYLEMVFM